VLKERAATYDVAAFFLFGVCCTAFFLHLPQTMQGYGSPALNVTIGGRTVAGFSPF